MAESSKKSTGKAGDAQHQAVQGSVPEGKPQAGKDDPQVAATTDEARQRNAKLRTAEPAGSGDQGVGTKQAETTDDPIQRGQQRMHIGAGHAAAPIEAPDAEYQTDPAEGHSRSSSNPVAALVGGQTYTGENHSRLTDQNGDDLSAEDLFEDSDPSKTFRVVKQRVYEEFHYTGSLEPMTRLLFPAGHRVSLVVASQIANAVALGRAQKDQEDKRIAEHKERFFAVAPKSQDSED